MSSAINRLLATAALFVVRLLPYFPAFTVAGLLALELIVRTAK